MIMLIRFYLKNDLDIRIEGLYLAFVKIILCFETHFINTIMKQVVLIEQVRYSAIGTGYPSCKFRPFIIFPAV